MSNLNEMQKKAIEADNNVVVVIAGAGSGKTTVLVQKVSKLILEDQFEAHSILAITFTNKAAKEMKERLYQEVGPYAVGSWIMTFHAFAVRLLRQNSEYLKNFSKNFLIIDEEDKKKILKQILKGENRGDEYKECLSAFYFAKKESMSQDEVLNTIDAQYFNIYELYLKHLIKHDAMDFDDLLLYAYELLQKNEVRTKYQQQFRYLLVDEFQDTSKLQAEILKLIKTEDNKLFIVGDVDQSIYTWRGATVDNMLKIEDHYSNVEFVRLEQNYRSTKNILNAANELILENKNRFDKVLWTVNDDGEEIIWNQYPSANNEANKTVAEIDNVLELGYEMSEVAILYRYNYQSRKLEEELIRNHIPYEIYGGLRFYERMEIKDILAYLRLFINEDDDLSFTRIINVPKRKIGEKTVAKYIAHANNENISLFKAIRDIGNQKLQDLVKLYDQYKPLIKEDVIKNFPLFLQDINYYLYLDEYDEKNEERKQNIAELLESIESAVDEGQELQEYLNDLALLSANDEANSADSVKLSTIHGVKGLEFDIVFLVGLSETLFPKEQAMTDNEQLEEERRLCYVAVTRARKQLFISNYIYNFKGEYLDESRFIKELGIKNENVNWDDFIF